MRKPGGYATIMDPSGSVVECDTFTCGHCQHIVHVPPKASMDSLGGWCRACMSPICPGCVGHPCTPWEKQMEKLEAQFSRDRLYEDIRK